LAAEVNGGWRTQEPGPDRAPAHITRTRPSGQKLAGPGASMTEHHITDLNIYRVSPVTWPITRLVRLRIRRVNELPFRRLHRN
jgi:hypothetical protein